MGYGHHQGGWENIDMIENDEGLCETFGCTRESVVAGSCQHHHDAFLKRLTKKTLTTSQPEERAL